MGCDQYPALYNPLDGSPRREVRILFNADEDDIPCVCCFPNTPEPDADTVTEDDVYVFALLGAALTLLWQGEIELDAASRIVEEGIMYTPSDLPEWLIKGIRQRLRR